MADERFYEQKLTNALVESLKANQNAKKFIIAAEKHDSLTSTICAKIARLIGVSFTEARTYIDYSNGTFKPGRWMPHCLDPELKNLFSQLEIATRNLKVYPYKTALEANSVSSSKTAIVGQVVAEIKGIFGEAKAKEIAARAKATAIKTTGIAFAGVNSEKLSEGKVVDINDLDDSSVKPSENKKGTDVKNVTVQQKNNVETNVQTKIEESQEKPKPKTTKRKKAEPKVEQVEEQGMAM